VDANQFLHVDQSGAIRTFIGTFIFQRRVRAQSKLKIVCVEATRVGRPFHVIDGSPFEAIGYWMTTGQFDEDAE